MSLSVITAKTLFLNSLLISLRRESVKGVFCIKTDISAGRGCLMDMFIEVSTKVR